MTKYRIIGNMTGNSMDAIDLVLTEFDGCQMTDICSFSRPFSGATQQKMANLRCNAFDKTAQEIQKIKDFQAIHDDYIIQIAECINQMCSLNKIDKKSIHAIGFHGKTLDHKPHSLDKKAPYTVQLGSGKMLADLTGIPVVYDFRSAFIMAGFDGAPLAAPHNAHVALTEGDGCYYNGGNTSNFAWIINGHAVVSSDAGAFNEYPDNFMRTYSKKSYDKDGQYGLKGKLDTTLLADLFEKGRDFYERNLPKSGDPQYYHTKEIFTAIEQKYNHPIEGSPIFCDIMHTLAYFAAYLAAYTLTLTDEKIKLPPYVILFGGGWKNPVVRTSFENLLNGTGFVLPCHQKCFDDFRGRFDRAIEIKYSNFGEFMEARLFADLARSYLEQKAWEIPQVLASAKKIVCGRYATPNADRRVYDDCINLAAKGWQK